MLRLKKNFNVVQAVGYRELNMITSPYKLSLNILYRLVRSDDSLFVKIWEAHSKQPILCEDGKLYFDNYRSCFSLCGQNSLPSELYRLPVQTAANRITDAVVYSGPVHRVVPRPQYFKPFFLSLSADNWLRSYDNFTGTLLQEVYLGTTEVYKFQHCDWETYGELLVLTSILNVGRRTTPTAINSKPRVLVALAVFSVLPLEFTALLEIDREVFGKECNHVNVSDGLMIVGTGSASNGSVRFYSFPEVLQTGILYRVKLNESCDALSGSKVGSYPAGLPLNCKLREAPPVLFEVRCSDYIAYFGGFPWHYIRTPPRLEGAFEVRTVANDNLAENGYLNIPNTSTEPNTITFHPDESGRIIHKSAHSVDFYHLVKNVGGKMALRDGTVMSFVTKREIETKLCIEVSRGRRKAAQKMECIAFCEKSVLADDYEEELDLYGILGFDPKDELCKGKVLLYDNMHGKHIKTIDLKLKLDDLCDYTLTLDLDTLVVVVKNEMRRFSCYIYRLHWQEGREGRSYQGKTKTKHSKAKNRI